MTTEERYRAILRNHLPAEAVDWVYGYLNRHKVHFHITRKRSSKYGDYRWPGPQHPFHEISVNGDLAPHLFLWVLLHEAAHLETRLAYGSRVAAHGHEWQRQYATLLLDSIDFFPGELKDSIRAYAHRIPLSHTLGRRIEEELQGHGNSSGEPVTHLDDLPVGTLFRLASKPDMLFVSLNRRRTRWLCSEQGTGRQFTVSGRAEVIPQP